MLDAAPPTALVLRARKVDRVLAETYPDAHIELDFDDPFQLLVVTVLSAQTTDRRVNAVRPTLFAACSAKKLAGNSCKPDKNGKLPKGCKPAPAKKPVAKPEQTSASAN